MYYVRELSLCPGHCDYISAFRQAWHRRTLFFTIDAGVFIKIGHCYSIMCYMIPVYIPCPLKSGGKIGNVSSGYHLFQVIFFLFINALKS